jgi:hypothetical protein
MHKCEYLTSDIKYRDMVGYTKQQVSIYGTLSGMIFDTNLTPMEVPFYNWCLRCLGS